MESTYIPNNKDIIQICMYVYIIISYVEYKMY